MWGFQVFLEERKEGMTKNADVSWPPSELVTWWSRFVDFSYFGGSLTKWNGSKLWSPGFSWWRNWGNGLKFRMLIYLNHLQNWLDYGHSLLIFSFWRYFDLVKRVKFGVSGHFGYALWNFLIMVPLLTETVHIHDALGRVLSCFMSTFWWPLVVHVK